MSVSVVNGFVCLTPQDIIKAKKGVDPSPNPTAASPAEKPEVTSSSSNTFGPASKLGGSLAAASPSPATVNALTAQQDSSLIDLLA